MSAPSALFVGLAAWDTIALVARYPEADSRSFAEAVVEAGGGPAATASVACARLGVASAFIGAVGDDARGERIVGALAREGVDVSGVVRLPGQASTAAVIVADRERGTRALCPTRPLPLVLDASHAARCATAPIIHTDQAGYAPLRALLDGRQITTPVSVDAGNPIEGLDPSRTALFAPTVQRLRTLLGPGSVPGLLRKIVGPRWAVATDGASGAFAREGERVWHVPAYAPDVCVSTLGAGDVFHGALVAAWVRGMNAPEALAYATIAAGFSCRAIDGRSAIPDHETVLDAMATHPAVALAAEEA